MAKSTKNSQTAGDDPKLYQAAMRVAAQMGWRRATLRDIADEAGITLAALHGAARTKQGILAALQRHIDETVLAGGAKKLAEDDSHRDRLFDVLMRRFDALMPYRDGLAAIVRECGGGGVVDALCGWSRLVSSMAWMLEAAGISSAGLSGRMRAKGLAAVYMSTLLTWLRDDTEDMSKTMAQLDRNLARAERFASMRGPGRDSWRYRRGESSASGEQEPEGNPA